MQAKKLQLFEHRSEFCKPRISSWGSKGEADKLVLSTLYFKFNQHFFFNTNKAFQVVLT